MSDIHRTSLLLPDALRKRLKATATASRRSVHAQILTYIEAGLAHDYEVEQAVLRNPEIMAAIRHAKEADRSGLRHRDLQPWPEECGPE